jgi:hypothetical protein
MGEDPEDTVVVSGEALEREIDELRLRTQRLIEELEGRVHGGLDRARNNLERVGRAAPIAAAGLGAGALIAAGVGAWWAVRRRRAGWFAGLCAALATMSATALAGRLASRKLVKLLPKRSTTS